MIHDYILNLIAPDHPHLASVYEQEQGNTSVQPGVGPEVGKLLGLLVRLTQAKRVLELGTSLGYSTIWLAEGLRQTGGRLTSVEYDHRLYEATRQNLLQAGLQDRVDLVHGDAKEVVQQIEGPFDLILQDSDKALYPELLERCISLTRLYGLIIADDALFKPMGVRESLSQPVDHYNQLVFSDPRLYSTLLPIGDGVVVSVKMRD